MVIFLNKNGEIYIEKIISRIILKKKERFLFFVTFLVDVKVDLMLSNRFSKVQLLRKVSISITYHVKASL